MQPEDRWKLQSISVTNFRGVQARQTFPFDGRSTLVSGDNGVGKSTIALALEWTLFGRFPSGSLAAPKTSFMVPVGSASKACRGEVVFTRGDRRLTVIRDDEDDTFSVDLDGVLDDSGTAPDLLEHTLGLDGDTFVRAVLLQQSKVRGLLTDELKERNRVLDRLLGMEVIETFLEVLKTKGKAFADAADMWREVPEQERERFESQHALLSDRCESAAAAARDAGFHNKDLTFAGLKSRYGQLSVEIMAVAKKYGVEATRLPEPATIEAAKKVSAAVENELRRIRSGCDLTKKLEQCANRAAELNAGRQRWERALTARKNAAAAFASVSRESGGASLISERLAQAAAALESHEKRLRASDELASLISEARDYIDANAVQECPVCERPLNSQEGLVQRLTARIDALATETLRELKAKIESARAEHARLVQLQAALQIAAREDQLRTTELEAERQCAVTILHVETGIESRIAAAFEEAINAAAADQNTFKKGLAGVEADLIAISEGDRAIRDALLPAISVRGEVQKLEAEHKKSQATFAAIETNASRMDTHATSVETIKKALLEAKEEIGTRILAEAKPRAEQLYKQLVQHHIFDELDIKTTPRANKVDYTFEVASSKVKKSAREARLVLSDGQMTAAALALFFALAESSQHHLDLLYVDDPTQNLDHPHKESMAKVVAELASRRQLVVSTQDEDFVTLLRDFGFEEGQIMKLRAKPRGVSKRV